jgi:hypothetical protein
VPKVVPVFVSWLRSPTCARPKIHHLDLALGRHHQVGAFDIAVDDAFLVRRLQPLCRLSGDIERFLQRQGARSQLLLDALALDEFHGDERASLRLVDFKNGADVGVIEGRGGLRFPRETRSVFFGGEPVNRREFQGDVRRSLVSSAL